MSDEVGEIILSMTLEAIIASIVVIVNFLMILVILKNSILREDLSLSLLLYLLLSEGIFSGIMIAACGYQIHAYATGTYKEEESQSWCLHLIFPPLFSSIRFFYPFCNAFIALEKLLVIMAPSLHRRITYLTVHRVYLILTFLLAILMTYFIVYWSRVVDVKSSVVCSNSGYPELIHKSESMVNMIVLTLGALCYLPVLAQIKKFVDRSRSEKSSSNRAYYVKFVSAVKWTSLILLSMFIFNLTPEVCNFLQLDIYRGYEFYFYLLFAAKPLFNTFVIGFGNRDLRTRILNIFCKKQQRKKSISAWPSVQTAIQSRH